MAIVYYRGVILMMLMVNIVGGAGLMWLRRLRPPTIVRASLGMPLVTDNVGNVLAVTVAVAAQLSAEERVEPSLGLAFGGTSAADVGVCFRFVADDQWHWTGPR